MKIMFLKILHRVHGVRAPRRLLPERVCGGGRVVQGHENTIPDDGGGRHQVWVRK